MRWIKLEYANEKDGSKRIEASNRCACFIVVFLDALHVKELTMQ
jgi:hypothetical protein